MALPHWTRSTDGVRISRRFTFRDYAQALAFVQSVSVIAEAQNHHPDIGFGWGYADIAFTTHAIGGLHGNDFLMAAKVDATYATNA